jgi:hypothetical protein
MDIQLAKTGGVPRSFDLVVDLEPAKVMKKVARLPDVEKVTRLPGAAEPRKKFLLRERGDGFTLIKAAKQVRVPSDDLLSELQTLSARVGVESVEGGHSTMHVSFHWRVSRSGYISLWPFSVFAFVAWSVYGAIGLASVVLGFGALHWPRDVRERRLELVSKLSDALGPHIVNADATGPYR